MVWRPHEPGWRVAEYQHSIAVIDRFATSYDAYLQNPDLRHRGEAETYVIGAAIACDSVGAVPGHAVLDRWGVGALSFLHEDSNVQVDVRETSGPVRAALDHARQEYAEKIAREERKRRNPLRWAGYGLEMLLMVPGRLLLRVLPGEEGEVPVPLVILAGLVSFVTVAGLTFTLIE